MPVTINGTGPVSGVTTLASVTTLTFSDSTTQTTGVPAPSTLGNVLTSNGTAWVSQAATSALSSLNVSIQQNFGGFI